MYNSTIDRAKLIDIAERHRNPSTGLISWVEAIKPLNKAFGESNIPHVWKRRYQRATRFLENLQNEQDEKELFRLKRFTNDGEENNEEEKKIKIVNLLRSGSKQIKEIAGRVGISEVETLGYLALIEQEGILQVKKINLGGSTQYAIDTRLKQEKIEYEHAVGEVKTKTFMVLSDSHMGSVNEQTSFVHYLYDGHS